MKFQNYLLEKIRGEKWLANENFSHAHRRTIYTCSSSQNCSKITRPMNTLKQSQIVYKYATHKHITKTRIVPTQVKIISWVN